MDSKSRDIEKDDLEWHNDKLRLKGPLIGMRHIQAILVFILTFVSYSLKSCLSTAIVGMTESGSSDNPDIPVYDWDNKNIILSSLLWSYGTFQIFAGYIAKRYGPKWFLFGVIFIPSAVSVLMPLCAEHFGSVGMIVCRVIQGLALGFIFPIVQGYMGMWIPKAEVSTLGTFMLGGCDVGTIFGTLAAGYFSASWWGWPAIFYLLGVIGLAWCILWAFLGYNSPEVHPHITEDEKNYIMSSMGHKEGEIVKTPWKAILTSSPFYAIIVAHLGNIWVINTFMVESPLYMVGVLGVTVDQSGVYSILGSALKPMFAFATGILSDKIIATGKYRVLTIRKWFHAGGTLLPAILYVILGFIPSDQTALCIIIITVATVLCGLLSNSVSVNYLDLSPKFAGVMFGIANTIAQVISIAAPLLVQYTVTDETDVAQWRILFLTTAGVVTIGGVYFLVFASDQRQWWNESLEDDKTEKVDENKLTN